MASLINILNLPLYLLSGGVLGAWDQFAPVMIEECRRRLVSEIAPIDDSRSSREYRTRVAQNLLEEFLRSL